MTTTFKNDMREVLNLAWQFIKRNGFSKSEAFKVAWRNYKLRKAMATRIVKFYFVKIDGTIREAYGCLAENMIPQTQNSGRRTNDTVQTYYDTVKQDWRCYKRANLVRVCC